MSEFISINPNSCDGCGACVEVCKKSVLELRDITDQEHKALHFMGKFKVRIKGREKSFVVQPENCVSCGLCVKHCHERAIRLA